MTDRRKGCARDARDARVAGVPNCCLSLKKPIALKTRLLIGRHCIDVQDNYCGERLCTSFSHQFPITVGASAPASTAAPSTTCPARPAAATTPPGWLTTPPTLQGWAWLHQNCHQRGCSRAEQGAGRARERASEHCCPLHHLLSQASCCHHPTRLAHHTPHNAEVGMAAPEQPPERVLKGKAGGREVARPWRRWLDLQGAPSD